MKLLVVTTVAAIALAGCVSLPSFPTGKDMAAGKGGGDLPPISRTQTGGSRNGIGYNGVGTSSERAE